MIDDLTDDLIEQLQGRDLIIDKTPEFGELVRCAVDGDRANKKSGWYVVHELKLRSGKTVLVGSFGNWRRYGADVFKLDFDLPPLTEEEKREYAERQEAQRKQAESEKRRRQVDAAKRAVKIWGGLPDEGKSPYLDRKKVRAFGVKFSKGSIVVPVQSADRAMVGLQFIDPNGEKKFLTGTAKRGAFHLIGWHEEYAADAPIAIAEGYATGASIHMATGWMVAVAFDAGNLLPVAKAMRSVHSGQPIIICADDDSATEGNPGVSAATAAARAIGARLVVPSFATAQAAA